MAENATETTNDVDNRPDHVTLPPGQDNPNEIKIAIEYVDLTTLVPYARNSRTHSDAQIADIVDSIREFGFIDPILRRGEMIVAGHARQRAAEIVGLTQVPTIDLDHLSINQARALLIAHNRLAESAGWDQEMLKLEVAELREDQFDLSILGFDLPEIDAMIGPAPEPEVPDPEAPPVEPYCEPGDVWLLGDHRIMCGDCRSDDDMASLMGDHKINVAVTSPPYASQRKYDESSGFKPIPPDDYNEWFDAVQDTTATHLADDGSFFLNIKEHCDEGQRLLYVKDLTIAFVREWQWHFVDEYVWTHGGTPMNVINRFKNGFEPIFHFTKGTHKFRPDNVRHKSDSVIDWGGRHPSQRDGLVDMGPDKDTAGDHMAKRDYVVGLAYPCNVLKMGTNTEKFEHGAMFPVTLPEFFINAYTDAGDIVFDPFMGSGTTLIAAEKLNRVGFGMEISPAYCDVIIKRWCEFTGGTATHEDTGESFPLTV